MSTRFRFNFNVYSHRKDLFLNEFEFNECMNLDHLEFYEMAFFPNLRNYL